MDYIRHYLYYFPISHVYHKKRLFSDSIFGRRTAINFLKRFGKIAHLLKTTAFRNRRYLIRGKLQPDCRLLETIGFQIGNRRRINRRVKAPDALARTDRTGGGNVLYRKLPVVIRLNKGQHFLDSHIVTLHLTE